MARTEYTRLSALFTDPFVARAFARIEDDASGARVSVPRPAPILPNGAAVRTLEDA